MISVDLIDTNPENPRKDLGDIDELAESIKKNGLLQPIIVMPNLKREGCYLIEAGERRYWAMRDWATQIPCVVRPPQPGENPAKRLIIVGLVENIFRKDLNPMERAHAYDRLRKEMGMNATQIAIQLGLSVSAVTDSLSLLELAPATQKRVRDGKLGVTEAKRLVRAHRAQVRRQAGQPRVGATWEPKWFAPTHPLAKAATAMCDARDHQLRRRFGGACGQCWELVIRRDQEIIDKALAESGDL